MISTNYYAVTCKCGHTGKPRSYTPITFAVKADNTFQAETIARMIPRVKHDSPTAILSLRPVLREAFLGIIEKNSQNPFLHCRSDEERETLGVKVRAIREPEALPARGNGNKKHCRSSAHCRGKEIIRNFRTYIRMHPIDNEEEWYE